MRPTIKVEQLTAIGYWALETEREFFPKDYPIPSFPHPKDFQDKEWNEEEKKLVIRHLKRGQIARMSRGMSWCRFHCGEKNMGTTCLTDGSYIFPEKLVHYLEEHDIRLPEEFVNHVKSFQLRLVKYQLDEAEINYSWWENILV